MEKLIWLSIFILSYWTYCIFWGWKGSRQANTASDYFIAGRGIGLWVFVLAATATSFSGWTFVGHPGLIYKTGLPYAFASFYAITIPFTGLIFLKRQWLLGKRFGYITPGEMFSHYYRSDAMRLLTIVVAMVFSVPYLGLQLKASGLMFNRLLQGTALENTFIATIEGGAILLYEDGVYAACVGTTVTDTLKVAAIEYSVFVPGPDLAARGIAPDRVIEGIEVVDYGGFVDLVEEHGPVQSWL